MMKSVFYHSLAAKTSDLSIPQVDTIRQDRLVWRLSSQLYVKTTLAKQDAHLPNVHFVTYASQKTAEFEQLMASAILSGIALKVLPLTRCSFCGFCCLGIACHNEINVYCEIVRLLE
jgi:hypothetical protein